MSITFEPSDWLVGGGVIGVIILLLLWRLLKRRRSMLDGWSRQTIAKQWQEVEQLMNQNSPAAFKLAVMEADKLVDYVLKSLGTPGKDFGERIRAGSYNYPQLRQVWPAHIVRNRIAHEPLYQLDARTARQALATFKQVLKLLRAL